MTCASEWTCQLVRAPASKWIRDVRSSFASSTEMFPVKLFAKLPRPAGACPAGACCCAEPIQTIVAANPTARNTRARERQQLILVLLNVDADLLNEPQRSQS